MCHQNLLTFGNIKKHASKLNTYLMIALGFVLPLSTALGSIVAITLIFFWVLEGDFRPKLREITANKITVSIIVFLILHLIALLWTENISWGLHVTRKGWLLLLMPILMTTVKRDHIPHYVNSFVLAMTISVISSYLVWAGIIEFGKAKPIDFENIAILDPSPFMTRVSYSPFLAWTIYLLLYFVLFNNPPRLRMICYSILIVIMIPNIFITGGRTGQVAFFVMIVLLSWQYFKKNIIKALIVSTVLLPLIFGISFKYSQMFRERMKSMVYAIRTFREEPEKTATGERIQFIINSVEIVRQHPFFGVGTGDFPGEYARVNKMKSPKLPNTDNPHNQYLLVLVQFGLLGLLIFLPIFYFQIKCSFKRDDHLRSLRLALPIFFLVIMLAGCYLSGHHTTLLFSFFGAILYKDCYSI